MTVIDELTRPDMREVLGTLMASSQHADMAIANIRLAALDLRPGEVTRLKRLRLVIGKVDAAVLLQSQSRPVDQLQRLRAFATSGIVEMRTVPRYQWTPDFSIFDRAALIGAHYGELPYPVAGAALTCVITDATAIKRCARRFGEMWELGYDILPVFVDTLDALLEGPACV